ncbi:putative ribonuclease H-like domain-containing protein [Tanacetum coccineum]|uniref:Ribonuclease H-like domain-containing protein n=1 Tax=Tanacetum coccineum TaxID=301880 RepID=A0ABQ4WVF0_9ASTR
MIFRDRNGAYLTHTEYASLGVIVNGDAPAVASASAEGPFLPKLLEQKLARKNELKAKSTLLLAIPDEHLLKFHRIKDAKTLWEAIKARFRGNKESKKMQKTILKQQYENLTASRYEGLDKTYDRFQKLISQLEIHVNVNSQCNEAEIKSPISSSSNSQNCGFGNLQMILHVTMLTIRGKRFLKKTGRNLNFNGKETVGFDKTKVECYNYHKRGHFARECKALRNQGNINGDVPRRIIPVDTPANALVVQDGVGGYDWSFQAEEGPTNFALIAHLSSGSSSSSSSDSEVRDNSIITLKNQLAEALKEKDDLKLKLEKFETSSKNLIDLLNSQISVNNKTGIGFDSQMTENELHDIHKNNSEVFESASDCSVNEIEEENNQVNDRFKKVEGYHAVPPPYTKNYMPLRPDLSFARLDDSVYKTNMSETITSMPRNESTASKSSKDNLEQPKDFRPSAPIVEERVTGQREVRPVWNNAQRVNHQNKLTHPHPKRNIIPTALLTKSANVLVNTAKQSSSRAAISNSTARYVNTAASRPTMNGAKPCLNVFHKSHSSVKRTIYQRIAPKNSNFKEKVNTTKVNNVTTAGTKAIVSVIQGHEENAVKSSACWIWRTTGKIIDHISKDSGSYMPKRFDYGNPQYALQDQGIFDSGCSRHMTGNKSPFRFSRHCWCDLVLHLQEVLKEKSTNKNTGIKDNVDVVPTQQYILLPLLYDSPQSSKDAVANDAGKKTNEEPAHEGERNEVSGAYDDEDVGAEADLNNLETTMNVSPIPTTRIHKDHPIDQIIGDINLATQTRRMTKISKEYVMKKKDDRGVVIRNKARLVAQGYTQEEGIDYDKVFTSVARIEAIRLFLAYASYMGFIMYQMGVKSGFLYGTIEEEVYVYQPPGFEDLSFPYKVYKVEKALYVLHQAPKAWYETLSTYLLENEFRRGTIDKTLFIKKDRGDILLVQVYVDDIIFRTTKKSLCVEFKQMMHKRFQISFMGELTFFLGLQVQQKEDGIFISQDKYVADILKKFDFVTIKTASTPMEPNKALVKDEEAKDVDVHLYRSMIRSLIYLTTSRPDITFAVCACVRFQVTPKTSHLYAVKGIFRYLKGQPKLGLWYPRDSSFDLEAFLDSDYAGASLDRKSTTGGCQFLGKRLISWQCKKQTIVANSTTEVEYVAAVFKDSFDGFIGLKMLFGPVFRVKHGKKLVSALPGLLYAAGQKLVLLGKLSTAGLPLEEVLLGV